MRKINFFKILEKTLSKKDKYFDKEQKVILRNTISEDAENFDRELLEMLLAEENLKNHFFVSIGKAVVFDKDKFLTFVNNKNFLPDSYTKFTQNIGLTEDEKFLKSSGKVVLNWPYKDCVLEGGQTKEEKGRNEVFFNEILERDEIDTLLKPKAFTNFRKYSRSKGKLKMENIDGFNRNKNGTIKDNLIIKGNNLLALYSLKEEFVGKVKLIYIDPPYNTGNDGFKYNDNFNHSTWLTFMKNRLEVARDLLSDDGVIFVSIDDDESHYLKILCDDIFKRENFVANIIWQKKYTIANDARYFSDNHDHILVFTKKKDSFKINGIARTDAQNERYHNPDNDPNGLWMTQPLHAKSGNVKKFEIIFKNGKKWSPPRGTYPRYSKENFIKFEMENKIWFGKNGDAVPRLKKYLKDMGDVTPATIWLHTDVGNNDQANRELKAVVKEDVFSTPKPEKLLQRIIELSTKENDIVLDFFAGSGTTGAVAHKMSRQYILVEQMDYINDLPEARIKKVIEGEQGGISKAINWKGGGEFVYMEMREFNQEFLEQVKKAKSKAKLKTIFKAMKEKAFLSYRFSEKEFEEKIDEFDNLSLEDQKLVLDELLDKNQMYLSHTEIRDASYKVSKKDIEINKSFYNKK